MKSVGNRHFCDRQPIPSKCDDENGEDDYLKHFNQTGYCAPFCTNCLLLHQSFKHTQPNWSQFACGWGMIWLCAQASNIGSKTPYSSIKLTTQLQSFTTLCDWAHSMINVYVLPLTFKAFHRKSFCLKIVLQRIFFIIYDLLMAAGYHCFCIGIIIRNAPRWGSKRFGFGLFAVYSCLHEVLNLCFDWH